MQSPVEGQAFRFPERLEGFVPLRAEPLNAGLRIYGMLRRGDDVTVEVDGDPGSQSFGQVFAREARPLDSATGQTSRRRLTPDEIRTLQRSIEAYALESESRRAEWSPVAATLGDAVRRAPAPALEEVPTTAWIGTKTGQVLGTMRIESGIGRVIVDVDSHGAPSLVRFIALCERATGQRVASWQRPTPRSKGGVASYSFRLAEGAVRPGRRYAVVVEVSFDGAPVTTLRSDFFAAE